MKISADKLAEVLKVAMELPFGGKPSGRFVVTRERLAELAGRKTLREPFLQDLYDAALDLGVVIVNLDTLFSVQDLAVIERHRSIPPSVIMRLKT